MEIVLPIIINAITILILLAGICVGIKNGWKLELFKMITVIGAGVGCYYLQPTVSKWVVNFKFLSEIPTNIINSSVYSILFLFSYLIISIIFLVIRKATSTKQIQGINGAKRVKIKGIDKKSTKKLRKENKEYKKAHRGLKELRTASKILGAIFGVIIAFIIGLSLFLPVKNTFNQIYNESFKYYNYTIYGKLDSTTSITNKIIKEI